MVVFDTAQKHKQMVISWQADYTQKEKRTGQGKNQTREILGPEQNQRKNKSKNQLVS